MKKNFVYAVVLLCSIIVITGCKKEKSNTDNSLNYIKDNGVLVLGLDDSFPPMGYRDESGEITGFDIDLAKEVASRLGVELKLQPIDWDAKILDLNSKDIDIIWNGLTITEDRKKSIEFSKPYIANKQIIIVQADSGIEYKTDLKDKKVGIQLGSSADDAVNSDSETIKIIGELVKYQDNVQALMDLEVGRIDAVVVDEILGRYYISKKTGVYDVALDNFAEEEYGIGIRKNELALKKELDRIIDEMVSDGSATEISKKWFAEDILLDR